MLYKYTLDRITDAVVVDISIIISYLNWVYICST